MGFPFDWVNGNVGTPQPFSLNDGGPCYTVDVTHLDKFNKFQEHVPSGWSLTNISCTSTTSAVKIIGANSNPAFQMGDTMVTIDLNEPNVTCTFVNRNDCRNVNLDLSTGVASWTVTPGPVGVITSLGPLTNVWVNPSPRRWIQPAALSAPQYVNGTSYIYSVPFNLPGPLNQYLGGIALTINRYAADNNVQGVSLNNGPRSLRAPDQRAFRLGMVRSASRPRRASWWARTPWRSRLEISRAATAGWSSMPRSPRSVEGSWPNDGAGSQRDESGRRLHLGSCQLATPASLRRYSPGRIPA